MSEKTTGKRPAVVSAWEDEAVRQARLRCIADEAKRNEDRRRRKKQRVAEIDAELGRLRTIEFEAGAAQAHLRNALAAAEVAVLSIETQVIRLEEEKKEHCAHQYRRSDLEEGGYLCLDCNKFSIDGYVQPSNVLGGPY